MFTERLNELLSEVCRTSAGEFSRITGYDRSYISHMRSGGRTLKPGRRAAQRLVQAICVCAAAQGAEHALRRRVGAPETAQGEALCSAVSDWLFEGENKEAEKRAAQRQRCSRSSFGSRLEPAMELAEVSSARLARSVNVDASLIAKYRSGVRVPQMNHPIIHSIAAALSARICALERTGALARLIGAPADCLRDEGEGARLLEAWLRDFSAVDTSVIENFLEGMDAFAPEEEPPLLRPEEAADESVLNDRASFYDGVAGLRRAVLRFLGGAVRGGWKELWLYSDQGMEWMLGERDFTLRWASLMIAYVRGGGRIRIIHHVDRGLEEMVAAIQSWMPLYLSGGVEGWYSLRGGGERFSHTLFLAPENACVECTCVAGGERARYRYVTDEAELAHERAVFEELLADCRPLLNMSRDIGGDKSSLMLRGSGDIHLLTRSISLGTMPETLLRDILRRAALPKETERKVLDDWAERRALLAERLTHGTLHECVALPTEEAFAAGDVTLDTVFAPLCYTAREFSEHLRGALALSEQEDGYRVYPLAEPPFARIRLSASEYMAEILYLSGRPINFTANHPLMARAFVDFAGRLERHHSMDRRAMENRMKQYETERDHSREADDPPPDHK